MLKSTFRPHHCGLLGSWILSIFILLLSHHTVNTFSDTFQFELDENSPPQTLVGQVTTRPGFTYRFNDNPLEFSLDPQSGVITTTDVPTDSESKSVYNLVILSSSPTYLLEVRIIVRNVNDNPPQWPAHITTNISFSESAPVGTRLLIDNALDADSEELRYQLDYVSDVPANSAYSLANVLPFKLDYNTSTSFLHIEVAHQLDREVQSEYTVNITAFDVDNKSSSALFTIRITDSNDNPPIFDQSDYTTSINESQAADFRVLQVRATDADEPGNENSRLSYYMNSDDFRIDAQTGVVYTSHDGPIGCGTKVTQQSDSEYWRVCVFTVFAHDYGVPRQDGRAYVTVKVYDSNNHSPLIKFRYFSKSDTANVDENATNGSVVAAVSVIDYDHGLNGQTSLRILHGNELGHFRLDTIGASHIIRVNASLDREKVSQYNLTLFSQDHGTPSKNSTAKLIIMVQDHNDHAPQFTKEVYETSLVETVNQVGLFVISVLANDQDEGINSQIFYSLSGVNSHYFRIDSASGLIVTNKIIDRETVDYFELKVTARDAGSNPKWAHALLKVQVLDVNDNPPRIGVPSGQLESKTGQIVVNVPESLQMQLDLDVSDPDLGLNGSVHLSLLYNFNGLFRIDHERMRIVSTDVLHQGQCGDDSSYELVVVATDKGPVPLRSLTSIKLKVMSNQIPGHVLPFMYPTKYFSTLAWNVLDSVNHSSFIVVIKLKLHRSSSAVHFELRDVPEALKNHLSVTSNGEVRYKPSSTTRFARKSASFSVECHRCQPGNNLSQINLFFDNANHLHQINVRTQYSFSIEENVPIGTVVGDVEVDLESYNLHLVEGNLREDFVLIGHKLTTQKLLDHGQVDSYLLTLVATSHNADHYFTIEVRVDLVDMYDSNPYFVRSFELITVAQDTPPMFTVYRLTAFDDDRSNQSQIQFEFIENPGKMFVIDDDQVKLAHLLDASNQLVHLIIRAIDSSSRGLRFKTNQCSQSDTIHLFINVQVQSMLKGRFVQKHHEIYLTESIGVGYQFTMLPISSSQQDSGELFSYSLVSGNINNSFGILPNGRLYVNKPLDREAIAVYLLQIQLHDSRLLNQTTIENFLDTCQVLVHIKDVNDNRPLFKYPSYHFSLPENVSSNFLIGQVVATDADEDANSEIVYSIVKSYYSSFVDIDEATGFIWSRQVFDREVLSQFEITVQATDQPVDEDKFTSQVVVTITVLDINDNHPMFEIPSNVTLVSKGEDGWLSGELSVIESSPVGMCLVQFVANDADLDSSIVYSLKNNENSPIVAIDPFHGTLTLISQLDRETRDSYTFTVVANDGKHHSYFNLKLSVEDVNDCEPEWINFTSSELFVYENVSIGTEILTFNVIDRDLGQNALFHFVIDNQSGGQKMFDILNQRIVVVNHLDYEKVKVHYLNVSLVEDVSGRVVSTKRIQINLIDINDCAPVFVQRSETEVVHVLENIDIGTKLLTLQATDCDNNDVLVYEIISCNTHYHTHRNMYQGGAVEAPQAHKHDANNCPLKLNTKTGEIININNLDREVIESINLKLSVKDSQGHMDKMKVIFIIEDINDESPVFVSPKKIVTTTKDLTRPGMVLGSVKAVDLDVGINSALIYTLSKRYESFLDLDKFTGVFKTKQRSLETLFAQQDDEILVNVTATDGGGLTTVDTIQFILKPNYPQVDSETVKIDIYENEPIGTEITKLRCPSAVCKYHLINATDRNFEVDSATGMISTVDFIDREMLEKRFLEVLVISQQNLQLVQVISLSSNKIRPSSL